MLHTSLSSNSGSSSSDDESFLLFFPVVVAARFGRPLPPPLAGEEFFAFLAAALPLTGVTALPFFGFSLSSLSGSDSSSLSESFLRFFAAGFLAGARPLGRPLPRAAGAAFLLDFLGAASYRNNYLINKFGWFMTRNKTIQHIRWHHCLHWRFPLPILNLTSFVWHFGLTSERQREVVVELIYVYRHPNLSPLMGCTEIGSGRIFLWHFIKVVRGCSLIT